MLRWVLVATSVGSVFGCSSATRGENPASGGGDDPTRASVGDDGATDASSGGGGQVLDVGDSGGPADGCRAVDLLFVIDNSESMQTYQEGLAAAFPGFIAAAFDVLPAGASVHVGITTTDFDSGCDAAEATQTCQSSASYDEVVAHYNPPTAGNDGGNGSQGRLFEYAGRSYFETSTDDDPSALQAWFGEAAVAAGEEGCSFEMPVAAAGFAAHPANARHNAGFIRDEGALLVVFFLTDEPDKSVESTDTYKQMLVDAKGECGGDACIFAAGLIPACTTEINQKLWQFMRAVGGDDPPWSDIQNAAGYGALVGETLAQAVAEACATLPVG